MNIKKKSEQKATATTSTSVTTATTAATTAETATATARARGGKLKPEQQFRCLASTIFFRGKQPTAQKDFLDKELVGDVSVSGFTIVVVVAFETPKN